MSDNTTSTEPDVDDHADFDVEAWLDEHWDPDVTVGEWWSRLAAAGLAHPMLPPPYGKGWRRAKAGELARAMSVRGVLGPPAGLGMMLAAPTILAHGSSMLIDRFVPRILDGQHGWCQLFSEPGAGSDLAGLQARAERDGDHWVVSGQKVWTSMGQWADYGILIARTDPGAPKHRGITYFAFPMKQDGVDVRPLREMTGHALFNEVFIDEARVPHDHMIGDLNDGWRVANTTLMVERSSIGGETVAAPSAAMPGTIAGHLGRPAGSFRDEAPVLGGGAVGPGRIRQLMALASGNGSIADPSIRQDLIRLHSMIEITGWHVQRMKTGNAATGAEGNLAKLRNSDITRLARDLGCRILGAAATVVGPDSASAGSLQELALFSPAPSIYGGSDQIQRNIIGERALGLPREPGPDRNTPFRDLPHNG
ncbi:MAG: acyl-CoA dehydrogenase family protein [Ilumatobacteraceae bacterium]